MDSMTDKEFLEFLESFDEEVFTDSDGNDYKCLNSLKELSKSETYPYDSIITDKFEMYGLDWIVKASDKWKDKSKDCAENARKCKHIPKTTDAIYCKQGENGNLVLHLIEFKFVNTKPNLSKIDFFIKDFDVYVGEDFVNGLKKVIKNNFVGKIDTSLQLKPYESLFIVLPELYDEYCKTNNKIKKDIKSYLINMEKYYWICIDSGTPNEHNIRNKAQYLEDHCKRMQPAIFKKVSAKTKRQFKNSLKQEILPN